MSDDSITDSNTDSAGIANLRSQYDQLQKELKAANEELSGLRAEKRTSTVASVLKARGLSEKAAALYSGDDTSEDAVGKWIEDYAEVFGITPASQQDQNTADAQRLTDVSFGTQPTTATSPDGKIIGNIAEMQHLMETLPYEELVKRGWMPADASF